MIILELLLYIMYRLPFWTCSIPTYLHVRITTILLDTQYIEYEVQVKHRFFASHLQQPDKKAGLVPLQSLYCFIISLCLHMLPDPKGLYMYHDFKLIHATSSQGALFIQVHTHVRKNFHKQLSINPIGAKFVVIENFSGKIYMPKWSESCYYATSTITWAYHWK